MTTFDIFREILNIYACIITSKEMRRLLYKLREVVKISSEMKKVAPPHLFGSWLTTSQ